MFQSKKVKIILAISLAAVLLVGSTWAYLTVNTNDKTNVFTFGDISAKLDEPKWDPEKAKDIMPGTLLSKDPQIKNTCAEDEYVGIKMTFRHGSTGKDGQGNPIPGAVLGTEEMDKLLSLIEIGYYDSSNNPQPGFRTTDWAMLSSGNDATKSIQGWYYKKTDGTPCILEGEEVVANQKSTPSLFDYINFKDDMTNEDFAWLQGIYDDSGKHIGGLKNGFEIYLEGAAIQASAFNMKLTGDDLAAEYAKITTKLDEMLFPVTP